MENIVHDELLAVLDELKNYGVTNCTDSTIATSNTRTTMCYISYDRRLNIYIEDTTYRNLNRFTIYKNKIYYFKYYGLAGFTCEDREVIEVRTGISTEEEYFQESTLIKLLDLEFEHYKLLTKIFSTISDKLEDE